jgi:hypothetical protein
MSRAADRGDWGDAVPRTRARGDVCGQRVGGWRQAPSASYRLRAECHE